MNIIKTKKKTENGILYKRTCAYCGKTVQYYHSEKPEYCPYCGAYNYIKPKTETTLFLLQKEYLEHGRNNEVLGKMYLILKDYAKSMIKMQLQKSGMTKYNYDDIDMKASDSATLLLEYYLTKPAFKIEQSFGGYLKDKVKQALYNKTEQREDSYASFNSLLSDSEGHAEEIGELKEQLNFNYIFGDQDKYRKRILSEKELVDGIHRIIAKITETVTESYNRKDSLLLLIGMYIRINNTNNSTMDNYYKYFGSVYKDFIDASLLLLYEFIKESQHHHH